MEGVTSYYCAYLPPANGKQIMLVSSHSINYRLYLQLGQKYEALFTTWAKIHEEHIHTNGYGSQYIYPIRLTTLTTFLLQDRSTMTP